MMFISPRRTFGELALRFTRPRPLRVSCASAIRVTCPGALRVTRNRALHVSCAWALRVTRPRVMVHAAGVTSYTCLGVTCYVHAAGVTSFTCPGATCFTPLGVTSSVHAPGLTAASMLVQSVCGMPSHSETKRFPCAPMQNTMKPMVTPGHLPPQTV